MAFESISVDFMEGGPCTWRTNPGCCSCWVGTPPDIQAAANQYAALVLWAATGRRYGTCPMTVRPCGRQCNDCIQGSYWFDGMWMPYISQGVWRNCWCGNFGSCTCEPDCQVYLPGPIVSVTTVTVDGVLVDDDFWRVDDKRWLVRTQEGECWPNCQDYNTGTGPGTTNTMEVVYQRGIAVPDVLATATGVVACEFAKACQNQACRLPGRMSTVARQGVQITNVNIDDIIAKGLTGIPEVDQVILGLNPYANKTRLRVSSPDLPVTRMTTII